MVTEYAAVDSVWDIAEQYTMRYSKGHRDEIAARILERVSVRIREQGLESITVATLMKMARLTHGGFYLHFESRDDLIDQAFAKAMESSVEVWPRISDRADGGQCLASIVEFYLAERHRLDIGNGCALTAAAYRIVDQTLGSLSRNRCEGPGWPRGWRFLCSQAYAG